MPTTPQDLDRLIHSVLTELGWNANASAIAERVRRLDVGLPCEDEFSVVCGWLGKCRLLHKLDQQQIPVSSLQEFQVPDLLALFSTQATTMPVLIEVKSKAKNILSFRPDYLEKLTNYANLLKMPLLIAWKFHNVWTLFEAKHLKKATKNFNISLETAAKENLLGVLVGDVAYTIGAGAGVHVRFRKDKMIGREKEDDSTTEKWSTTPDGVAFTDYHGNRRTDLDSEVRSLFTAWDLEEQKTLTDTHITVSFVAGSEGIQFAHTSLVHLLNWELPRDQDLNWRHLLQGEKIIKNIENFSAALNSGLKQNIVYYVFHLRPHTIPDFISP